MEIIPAIDILGGRCVRLAQGDYARETVFGDDPVAMAVRWASLGAKRIHVVDLDGARSGERTNAAVVSQIVDSVSCAVQTSGGIRSVPMVREMLDEGVNRVVIGTGAVKDPAFLREAIAIAHDRLIVSVDAREGKVSLQGWTEATDRRSATRVIPGPLLPGESVELPIRLRIANYNPGTLLNVAEITGAEDDLGGTPTDIDSTPDNEMPDEDDQDNVPVSLPPIIIPVDAPWALWLAILGVLGLALRRRALLG